MMSPAYSPPVYDGMHYYSNGNHIHQSSQVEYIPHRLFVGGFPTWATENDLRAHFEQFFRIRDAKIIRTGDGSSRGYGFVTFTSEEDADLAKALAPEKLEFQGRRLNLGPAIRKMMHHRFPADYSVATPTGIYPASYGFVYPMNAQQHFTYPVMQQQAMQPQPYMTGAYVSNASPPPQYHQMQSYQNNQMNGQGTVGGSVVQEQQQKTTGATSASSAVDVGAGDCGMAAAMSTPTGQSPPVTAAYPTYSYYPAPIQPGTPVGNACYGYPQGYYPSTMMTPNSAPPPGIMQNSSINQQQQLQSQSDYMYNTASNLAGASGDSNLAANYHQQMTPSMEDVQQKQPQPQPAGTPQQRGYAAVVAQNCGKTASQRSTAAQNSAAGSETPHRPSNAVRRIDLFQSDRSNSVNSSSNEAPSTPTYAERSKMTPVRLESRPRGPDGSYRQANVAAQHVRFIRSPPSDTKSLPPACPPARPRSNGRSCRSPPSHLATNLVNKFQEMHVSPRNNGGNSSRSGSGSSLISFNLSPHTQGGSVPGSPVFQ